MIDQERNCAEGLNLPADTLPEAPFFPAGLNLVEDRAFAVAYESISPEQRGALKVAIARLGAVYGSPDRLGEERRCSLRQGVDILERSRPVDWAALFWSEEFTSPSQLLAALLPAILAGVPDILACRVRGTAKSSPFPPAQLVALELAGQESVAEVGPEMLGDVLRQIAQGNTSGRIILLGSGLREVDPLVALPGEAEGRIAVWRRCAQQRIGLSAGVVGAQGVSPSADLLAFAHSGAFFHEQCSPDMMPDATLHAIFCGAEEAGAWLGSAPLVLTPGQESCWLWPDLEPGFFRERRISLIGPA